MAILPSDKFVQATLRFTGTAVPLGAAITFGVGTVATQSIEEIADNVADAWDQSGANTIFVDGLHVDSWLFKQGPNDVGAAITVPVNEDGGTSQEAGYAGASILVQKRTGLGGRRNRGRFFLPGISETQIEEGGGLNSSFRSSVQAIMDDLLERLLSTDGPHAFATPMVVLHSSGTDQPVEVLTLVVDGTIATQRRRQRR